MSIAYDSGMGVIDRLGSYILIEVRFVALPFDGNFHSIQFEYI